MRDGRVRYDIAKPIRYALSQHAGGARRTGTARSGDVADTQTRLAAPLRENPRLEPRFPDGGWGDRPPFVRTDTSICSIHDSVKGSGFLGGFVLFALVMLDVVATPF